VGEELFLKPNRERLFVIFLVAVAFCGASVWMLPHEPQLAPFLIVCCAAGALIALVAMLPGAMWLRIGNEGFQTRAFFYTKKLIRWKDIAKFEIYTYRGNKMLGWRWKWEYTGHQSSRAINGAMGFPDGTISNLYGRPEGLWSELEGRRERAS